MGQRQRREKTGQIIEIAKEEEEEKERLAGDNNMIWYHLERRTLTINPVAVESKCLYNGFVLLAEPDDDGRRYVPKQGVHDNYYRAWEGAHNEAIELANARITFYGNKLTQAKADLVRVKNTKQNI